MITDQSTAQSPKGATGLFLPTIYLSNNSAVKTFFKADMHARATRSYPSNLSSVNFHPSRSTRGGKQAKALNVGGHLADFKAFNVFNSLKT